MRARIKNPALLLPNALQGLLNLATVAKSGSIPQQTLNLVYLRASQINGCSVCVDMHGRELKKNGETDARLLAVGAWHDTPYFTDAERAALALTETATRISDRTDPVNDDVWNEAAKYYSEQELALLVLNIGMINLWNRLNVATRQVAGEWEKAARPEKSAQVA